MSTARKPPKRYGLTTDPGQPSLVDAASLALTILRAAKVGTWTELFDPEIGAIVIPYEVVLTDEQLALLVEHQHLLAMVRRSTQPTTDAEGVEITPGTRLVTFAVCPQCQRWILMSAGSAPARCTMTVNCPGAPIKAPAAKQGNEPEHEADYLATGEISPQPVGSADPPDIQPDDEPDSAPAAEVQPAAPEQTEAAITDASSGPVSVPASVPEPESHVEPVEAAPDPAPAYIPESTPEREDRELALVGAPAGDPGPDDLEDFD